MPELSVSVTCNTQVTLSSYSDSRVSPFSFSTMVWPTSLVGLESMSQTRIPLPRNPSVKRLLSYLRRSNHERRRPVIEPSDAYAIQSTLFARSKVNTIFDIGANIGQTTAVYSRLFPKATIYSFEPFPMAFEELA